MEQKYPEFRCALKAGKEASDDRVERSLYQLAIGWNGQPPNTTVAIFWLKNRRPDSWRDVQNIEASHAHYIVADRPMTEAEWIAARADRAQPVGEQQRVTHDVATELPDTEDDAANPL